MNNRFFKTIALIVLSSFFNLTHASELRLLALSQDENELPESVEISFCDGHELLGKKSVHKSLYSRMNTIKDMLTGPGRKDREDNKISLRADIIVPRALNTLVELIQEVNSAAGFVSLQLEEQKSILQKIVHQKIENLDNQDAVAQLFELYKATDFLGIRFCDDENSFDAATLNIFASSLTDRLIKLNNKVDQEKLEQACQAIKDYGRLSLSVLSELNSGQLKPIEILKGHNGPIRCLLKLDKERFASGYSDGTICIWHSKTGECLSVLGGHRDSVSCLLKLDDARFVSGSYDGTIRIWNSKTGECLSVLKDYGSIVCCLLSLDEKRFASGSCDRTIRIWDSKTGECLSVLKDHSGIVHCLLSLDEERLASGSLDKTIRIWNSKTGECLSVLGGHRDAIRCLLKLDEERFASGSWDTTIRIWNSKAGECLSVLEGHSHLVCCLLKLDEERIASGSYDKTIRIWNSKTGECFSVLKDHSGIVHCLLNLDEKRFASGSDDKTMCIWHSPAFIDRLKEKLQDSE